MESDRDRLDKKPIFEKAVSAPEGGREREENVFPAVPTVIMLASLFVIAFNPQSLQRNLSPRYALAQ